jgi:hypothetical protein
MHVIHAEIWGVLGFPVQRVHHILQTDVCDLIHAKGKSLHFSSNNNSIQFNSLFNVLYQQPNGQLQIQHKQNNNNKEIAYNYFSKDKFQLVVTQDINKIIERKNNNNNKLGLLTN